MRRIAVVRWRGGVRQHGVRWQGMQRRQGGICSSEMSVALSEGDAECEADAAKECGAEGKLSRWRVGGVRVACGAGTVRG